MISIYNYNDVKSFILARFEALPKRGRGQALKLSYHLSVHTTLVSQILKGLKPLTLEQASLTAEFLELTEPETDYFLLLAQLDRAGNESLRKNLKRQLNALKAEAKELVNRLKSETKLAEVERGVFYSDWSYSAVRQLTAIVGLNDADKISEALGLSRKRTKEIIDFLLKTGLCVEENNKLKIGPKSTHLESSSPWVRVHHINWRQKAIEKMNISEESQLHYTAPMTLSAKDAIQLREMIVKFLEATDKVIEPSPSEELHCLNIDWFKI